MRTDPPETVSEGQGYGMAIAAAIGDKDLVTKLWKFVRSYLSQSKDNYQESLGVYSVFFLTGNFPNPVAYSGL